MSYFVIPTTLGQTAIANAISGAAPISLATMVIGDGNGAPVTPNQAQRNLVNQVYSLPLASVSHVGNTVTAMAVIGDTVGGWTIREVGLIDTNGDLLFVGNVPDTLKQSIAMGVDDILTMVVTAVVSASATVTIISGGQFFVSIADMLRAPFIAVNSATTATPPSSPASGDTYLVPAGATGAWSGSANLLTQWSPSRNSVPAQWVFADAPVQTVVGVADTNTYLERTSTGWRSLFASIPEHLAGTATALCATPAGVAAMLATMPTNTEAAKLAFMLNHIH